VRIVAVAPTLANGAVLEVTDVLGLVAPSASAGRFSSFFVANFGPGRMAPSTSLAHPPLTGIV
jgi:hypothetical protein